MLFNNLLGFNETINEEITKIEEVSEMFAATLQRHDFRLKEEGREEELKILVRSMFKKNISPKEIAAITERTESEIMKIIHLANNAEDLKFC